jgi:hypothetical protein
MTSEKDDNFTWILQMCFDLLKSTDDISKVIVIDRDMALMNSVVIVFPKTTTLVCRFYIFKNIRAKCKTDCIVKSNDAKVVNIKGKDSQEVNVKEKKVTKVNVCPN